jgi:TatA/E family protein of Tat protein translocase
MNLGPAEIGLIVLAVMLLFGYKKLPDASRSLGRSLRIFKGEMEGCARAPSPWSRTNRLRGRPRRRPGQRGRDDVTGRARTCAGSPCGP